MSDPLRIAILSLACFVFVVFVRLIRKKSLKPFYSLLWAILGFFLMSLVFAESLYKNVATLIGLTDASFLVVVGIIVFLVTYVLNLAIKMSEMSDRIQELISTVAILERELLRGDKK